MLGSLQNADHCKLVYLNMFFLKLVLVSFISVFLMKSSNGWCDRLDVNNIHEVCDKMMRNPKSYHMSPASDDVWCIRKYIDV